jgi:ribonuclease Z
MAWQHAPKKAKGLQVTFLGTSSGIPTRSRNVSSVALRLPQRSELWLFDCGEATQHQFLRSQLRVSQLKRIFITHMHGDHIFGLPGLLASLGLAGTCAASISTDPICCGTTSKGCCAVPPPASAIPCAPTGCGARRRAGVLVFEDDDLTVRCAPLHHRVPAYAYRVDQKPRPGRFDVERARALGIAPGPIYAQLKAGRTVTLDRRPPDPRRDPLRPGDGRVAALCTAPTRCTAKRPWNWPAVPTC